MERSLAKSILGDMSKTLVPKFVRVFLNKRVDQSSYWSHRTWTETNEDCYLLTSSDSDLSQQTLVCVPDTGFLIVGNDKSQ